MAVGLTRGRVPLLFAIAWGAWACGGPDRTLAGTWQGYRDLPGGLPSGEAGRLARNVALVRLTLRSEGTFDLVTESLPFAGTWSRSGNTIALAVTSALGRPLGSQPAGVRSAAAAYEARVEGTLLRFRDLGGGAGVLLERRPEP